MNNAKIILQNTWLDDTGELIVDSNKVIRRINKNYKDVFKKIVKTGFFKEIVEKELLIPFEVIEDGENLVTQVEFLYPLIYPYEWTFTMYKKAALSVIEIATIAKKYNIPIKDCHVYNFVPFGDKMLYVDIGSFLLQSEHYIFNIKEFIESYYYPLLLWSKGLDKVVRSLIANTGILPTEEYCLIRYPITRLVNKKLLKKLISFYHRMISLQNYSKNQLKEKIDKKYYHKNTFFRLFIKSFISFIKIWNPLEINLSKLKNKINDMKLDIITTWYDYYKDGFKLTNRFQKIIYYTKQLCPDASTAISFGGNCGFFENELLNQTQLKYIIVQDADSKALDEGYKQLSHRKDGKRIYFMNYDFLRPYLSSWNVPVYDRVKSDIVYALALTHHLILAQGFKLDYIMKEFKKYTNKYIFVEFMPLGLWVPGKNLDVPQWYNENFFANEFKKHFELIKREKLEENRVLYIGKIKDEN